MTRLCSLPEDDSLRPGRVAIEVDVRPAATTIVIRGELDLVTMPALAGRLARLARLARLSRGRPGRLVFDLAATRFLDCGSARLIAGSGQRLAAGGRPVIRRPAPGARRVLGLTGLDADCEIEELVLGNIRTWCFMRVTGQSGAGR
jgi:anti-anti-sigma factor